MAERHVLIVHTRNEPGTDAEYNEWYDSHLTDLLKVPGVVAAQRFTLNDTQLNSKERPYPYLAIYEIEGDPAVWKEWMDKTKGSWPKSSAMAASETSLYSEYAPRRVAQPEDAAATAGV